MQNAKTRHRRSRGSILYFALVALALMSIALSGVVAINHYFNRRIVDLQTRFHEQTLAESGIALGSHPEISPEDPVLSQKLDASNQISIHIESEQAKLNINYALEEENAWILERLFTQWKIPAQESAMLIARMQDWIDLDSAPRPGGAEARQYEQAHLPFRPANRPFRSLDEMKHVLGIELLNHYQPDWRDYFTIYGNGRIDILRAPKEILIAVLEINEDQIQRWMDARAQKDASGHPRSFQDIREVQNLLGIPSNEFKKIAQRITLKEEIRKIHSVGTSNSHSYAYDAVLRWENGKPIYIEWKESEP